MLFIHIMSKFYVGKSRRYGFSENLRNHKINFVKILESMKYIGKHNILIC